MVENETTRSGVQIRRAIPADLDDIRSCACAAYARYVPRMGRDPAPMHADFAGQIAHGDVYVAHVRGRFAGYVVYYPGSDELVLENVAVRPGLTGKGIGKALIGDAERAARRWGFGKISLYTNEAMVENLGMYPKLGYREVERKTQQGFRRVFFEKKL